MLQIRPSSFDTVHYVFCGLSPDHVNQCATICLPQTFGRQKCPPVLPFPPVKAVWGTRESLFYGPDRKGKSPTVNIPEALPAILGGGARAFRSIPIAASS